MTAYELALKYYPKYWDDKRIETLAKLNKLTEDQIKVLKGVR